MATSRRMWKALCPFLPMLTVYVGFCSAFLILGTAGLSRDNQGGKPPSIKLKKPMSRAGGGRGVARA